MQQRVSVLPSETEPEVTALLRLGIRRSEIMAAVDAQLSTLLKRAIAIVEADRELAIRT